MESSRDMAERRVAKGEEIVTRQRMSLARITAAGCDPAEAEQLLADFEAFLARARADLDVIKHTVNLRSGE